MPGGPGNLAWQMPPREDDIMRRTADLQRMVREQASAQTGQAMQIGAGGILVNGGGSITIQGTGSFNTNGAISTTGPFTAASVSSSGPISGDSLTITNAGSVGGNLSVGGLSTGGSISASSTITGGSVYSSAAFQSPGSRALVVTVGYVNAYLDTNGFLGYQPSTRRVKKDLQAIPESLLDATLRLPTHLGRYITEADDAPLTPFLIAEDVRDAGFGPSVVPLDEGGEPAAINHQNLVPVLLELIKSLDARVKTLEEKLAGAGN